MTGYKCPTCRRDDFAREVDMKAHHTKIHGESLVDREHQLKCPACEEYFASEAGMKAHHASAHGKSIAKPRNISESTRKDILERDDSQLLHPFANSS